MHPPSATPSSQEDIFSTTTSMISPSTIATAADVHSVILQPRITPSPTTCTPNTLIVHISTALVIPDFNLFYAPTSIQSFLPTYTALADGSLLTPALNQDQIDANLSLLVTGALAMVFARNIFVSGDYIRRGKVKKKTLFHILFISQILSPVAFVPFIMSYFSQRLNCTLVIILSCMSGTSSLALLITVILGVKVYKCLNNARLVPIILGLFQIASTIVVIFDITKTHGVRRLTGSCIRYDDLRFTRYFVIIQFLESLFICGCFIYVCWKSRGSSAVRGRISIELSMEELPIEVQDDPPGKDQPTRRGWWDYVPDKQAPGKPLQQQTSVSEEAKQATKGIFRQSFHGMVGPRNQKLPSLSGAMSRSLKRRTSEKEPTIPLAEGNRHSLAPSSMSRFSRLMPRMELFQEVMKDELLYTTFITSTCVIVAVLAIIGVNFKNGLNVTGWIALNWCIISLLAIHSFGRVVHRHERDALLQHSVTCTAVMRAAKNTEQTIRRRVLSETDRPSQTRSLRTVSTSAGSNFNDPFADERAPQENNPFYSTRDDHDSSSITSMLPTKEPSSTQTQDMEYPTFGLGTPVVSEFSRQQGYARSWISSDELPYSNSDKGFGTEAAK